MRKWYCGGLLALGWLAIAGCAERPAAVTPADLRALLRTGQPPLHCRDACLGEWRKVQPQAAQHNAAGRWAELAGLVLRIGYQDDLSLYYIGRAAEGMGLPAAAASYYRQSMQLSGTSASCQRLSRLCGDTVLPGAASARLAALEGEASGPRLRRSAPTSRPPATPERPEREAASPPAGETPAPAPTEFTAPQPAAAPQHVPSDYIEPPPAQH